MRALIILSIILAICATEKNPASKKINKYVDEYKELIYDIQQNVTFLTNFTSNFNKNVKKYVASPNFSGVLELAEKTLRQKYNANEGEFKKCIQDKNSDEEELKQTIDVKREKCKKHSKLVFNQIEADFKKMTETGESIIKSVESEIEKCLKKHAGKEEKCVKCLSEKRESITGKLNKLSEQFESFIEEVVPRLEYSTGLLTVCVKELEQFIKTSEKFISRNLQDCAKKANRKSEL